MRWTMEIIRIILKIAVRIIISSFLASLILQTISYSFYKGNRRLEKTVVLPEKLQYMENLSGYGYNLTNPSDYLILCFGGSFYIAYNTVGQYAANFDVPFLTVDYYGTQDSQGDINLQSMQASATLLYDWAEEKYPGRKIIVIGHSYGCGMAAYLASVRKCEHLFLVAGFRDLADLYNRIIPIFWGPMKLLICDNIKITEYAKNTNCPVTIIGSDADRTLSSKLQKKLAAHYETANLKIFPDIKHEFYLNDDRVISLIKDAME